VQRLLRVAAGREQRVLEHAAQADSHEIERIAGEQFLMGGDLEIDSIDILQLILEIERHFGIKLVTGKFEPEAWATVNSLAATIESRLVEAGRQ